jgi:hypothetical protein
MSGDATAPALVQIQRDDVPVMLSQSSDDSAEASHPAPDRVRLSLVVHRIHSSVI